MTTHQPTRLGRLIAETRQEVGLSRRALADKAGVSASVVDYIEIGRTTEPTPQVLKRIGEALSLPIDELYKLAGYRTDSTLPELGVYLRARHPELPAEAISEARHYVDFLKARYGISGTGPAPGEDEA